MSQIKPLSNLLISQIAAGEVIERPASVIKELVENAIDAQATAIYIQIIEGGLNQIVIQDNGNGIEHHQLELAVTRHATSKINTFEDLTNVASFGFRGEALAAVSAVSRFRLTSKQISKPAEQSDYYSIDNYNNTHQEKLSFQWIIKSTSEPFFADSSLEISATTIEIEDLFHQVPVRKRFLKSASVEQKHVLETIKHFALQHPNIAFRLVSLDINHSNFTSNSTSKKNRKILFDVLATTQWQQRLTDVLGEGQFFESTSEHLQLTTWILEPTNSTNHSLYQFLFVNGRYIKDRGLQQSIRVAWQDSLHSLGNPSYALFLTLPHEEIDVNVHPAKTEIRFRHGQVVYNWVRQTMRQALRVPLNAINSDENQEQEIQEIIKPAIAIKENHFFSEKQPSFNFQSSKTNNFKDFNKPNNWTGLIQKTEELQRINDVTDVFIENNEKPLILGTAIAQLHRTYILAENDNGLIIVDMHAAHERILLEQSRKYHEECPSQQLLIPIQFNENSAIYQLLSELYESQSEQNKITELQNYWKSIGIHLHIEKIEKIEKIKTHEKYSFNISITHLPNWCQYLEEQAPVIFLNAIEHFLECGVSYELIEQFEEKMANWHCHRAIRHGDILTIEEMNELLRLMENTPAATRCNHGRPTWYQVSLNEINGWFLRGK